MSHAFVCLPTLESTTFEQQLCSAKLGYANALLLGTSSWKKGMWHTSSKKSSATLTVVGLNDKRAAYIASSKFSEPKRFVRRLNKFGGKYIQEQQLNQFHCHNLNRVFFSKDGPESFQVIDWYPNEKMVVVPVCLYVPCFDVGCCSSECVGVVSH